VNASTNFPCRPCGWRRRPWRLLVANGDADPVSGYRAGLYAEPCERTDCIQRRRMFLLPCRARPARSLEARRRLAIPSPFGTFYAPNISPDPVDGIGRWSEADFVGAVTRGISPTGFHYFPAFPYASYQHAKVDDVRDLFAYLKTLSPRVRQGARSRLAVSIQCQAQYRDLETHVHGRQAVDCRTRRTHRSGIAAPIWSTASDIAPSATVLVTFLAELSPHSASPVDQIRKARAGCRTSRKRD